MISLNLILVTDLDPVRREDRKWSVYALIAYWFSDAFNATTLELASSILAIGLSYKDAFGIVALGFLIIGVVISLNGATGVIYHAPFPVLARAGWGFWGSYGKQLNQKYGIRKSNYYANLIGTIADDDSVVPIISRVLLAVFWFAVLRAQGGDLVQVMITAIWPSFGWLHNSIPANQDTTSAQMVSFFLCQISSPKTLQLWLQRLTFG